MSIIYRKRLRIGFKGPNQGPKIMIWMEYLENDVVEYAKVLWAWR